MASKIDQLIRIIYDNNRQLNASQISKELNVSVRTLHNYINNINAQYPKAITSTKTGYYIEPNVIQFFLDTKKKHIPQTANERCSYILNKLIQTNGIINIYDLCEEIYISTTTFQSLKGKLKRIAKDYDLSVNISSNTIVLSGQERNKRKLLSSLLYSESSYAFTSTDALQTAFPSINIDVIRKKVTTILMENKYFINDYSLMNLLLHVAIAINRMKNDNMTPDNNVKASTDFPEYALAIELSKQLETSFNVKFSNAELYEMGLLLASRASSLDYNTISIENISSYIGNDCLDLTTTLVQFIKEYCEIDLQDTEFFIRFALHLHNTIIRAKHEDFCKNPLVTEIRQSCPLIYDVSVQLSGIIMEKTGVILNEDEIAFIALHIGGALEAQKEIKNRISAVLFCPSYYNLNSDLQKRINSKFDDRLIITNIYTEEKYLVDILDDTLLLSTVPIRNSNNKRLVVITSFLTNFDIVKIEKMIDKMQLDQKKQKLMKNLKLITKPELFEVIDQSYTKEELIHYMSQKLLKLGYVDDNYEKEILEREQLCSTSYDQFAIPHTLKMHANKTAMYILINHTPILWDNNQVNLVVMLCFNYDNKKIFYDIFEPLSTMLLDSDILKGVINCEKFNSLIEFLVENYN